MASERLSSKGPDAEKLLGVELLRFASAIAVLVFHYQHFAFVGTDLGGFTKAAQPFYSMLQWLYEYGFYGVQVFWCISGFIFFWKYADKIAAKKVSGYAFFVLRLSRLYPLHLVTLLFMVVAQWVYFRVTHSNYLYVNNDGYHFLLQLVLASDWGFQVGESFNGPIWSISIEVLVYLLFFLSIRWLSAASWVPAVLLLPALMVVGFGWGEHPLFYCMLFFYVGCYTAIAYRIARSSLNRDMVVTILSAAVILLALVLLFNGKLKPLYFLFVFSPALILLCVRYVNPAGVVADWLADAGNITYASYLLHVPLQITVCAAYAAMGQAVPWGSGILFVIYMLGMLVLSHYCYRAFEMPMQRWVRRKLLQH